MSSTNETENLDSEATTPDVVNVFDRVAYIESIINQIIVGYCKPRNDAWEFMWSIVLDTSITSLGAKVKVAMAAAHELGFDLERNALHRVMHFAMRLLTMQATHTLCFLSAERRKRILATTSSGCWKVLEKFPV